MGRSEANGNGTLSNKKIKPDQIKKIGSIGNGLTGSSERSPLLYGSDEPKDTCHLTYIIFYLHGIGHLLPWNFFITATQVWKNVARRVVLVCGHCLPVVYKVECSMRSTMTYLFELSYCSQLNTLHHVRQSIISQGYKIQSSAQYYKSHHGEYRIAPNFRGSKFS